MNDDVPIGILLIGDSHDSQMNLFRVELFEIGLLVEPLQHLAASPGVGLRPAQLEPVATAADGQTEARLDLTQVLVELAT